MAKKIVIAPRTASGGYSIVPEGEWSGVELASCLYSCLGVVLGRIFQAGQQAPDPKVKTYKDMPGGNGGLK